MVAALHVQPHVTFDPAATKLASNSIQNATEDTIETIHNDDLEPYRSPFIKCILDEQQGHAGAIDHFDVLLPSDGPPLPGTLVASLDDIPLDGAVRVKRHISTLIQEQPVLSRLMPMNFTVL
jgi:hypothetical protein